MSLLKRLFGGGTTKTPGLAEAPAPTPTAPPPDPSIPISDQQADEVAFAVLRKVEARCKTKRISEGVAIPFLTMIKGWYLHHHRGTESTTQSAIDRWSRPVEDVVLLFIDALPEQLIETAAKPQDGFAIDLGTFIQNPAWVAKEAIDLLGKDEYSKHHEFYKTYLHNEAAANGIRYGDLAGLADVRDRFLYITNYQERHPDASTADLYRTYLRNTPFGELPLQPVGYRLDRSSRFEHMHVLGGSGHGKTQFLQQLILEDISRIFIGEKESLFVIDSQGDMIDNILHLAMLSPEFEENLADRIVLIDPNDIEHPPCLNLFDVGLDRLDRYSAVEREKLMNGAIALYEYIFGSLLGAELTQRQSVIFRYLARLLMVVPGATIHTLREFMQDPESAVPYLERLDGTTRAFFDTQFFDKSFDDTRQQILTRLWGILSNPVLERMFTNERNQVNLFDALNDGKIVLVNTAKDLLKQDGCEMLGRFFIALLTQATQERAAIAPEGRTPTMAYIDEAQDYFDDNIDLLLSQARKYRVGLTLAHQNLGQFSRELLASVMASTATKVVGGASPDDRTKLARAMNCDPDFIASMRKGQDRSEFAYYVRNQTPQALRLTVSFGVMERSEKSKTGEYERLIEANRNRVSATDGDHPKPQPPSKSGGFELGEHEAL